MLLLREQIDQAQQLVDELIGAGSADSNTWLLNANIPAFEGEFVGALVSLNRSLTLEPGHLAARLARSALLLNKGEMKAAAEDVDFILEKIPREPRAKYLRAVISASQGDVDDASARVNEVVATLKRVPAEVMAKNPGYLYLAGITSYQLGSYDIAKVYLNKYLKAAPMT